MLEFGFIFRAIAAVLLALPLISVMPATPLAEGRNVVAEPVPRPPVARPGRLEPGAIEITRGLLGRSLTIAIRLPEPAPFRVYTLAGPERLVVDLEGIGARGFHPAAVALVGGVDAVRAAPAPPGWARLVFDLARPFAVETAELAPDGAGVPVLRIVLGRVSAEEFVAAAGAPSGVALGGLAPDAAGPPITIVLDPGHGGVDPGATRAGVSEKDVVLAFAKDLATALTATGRFRPILTRDTDLFLPLGERSALAAAVGARAFVSIHVNAVEDNHARGGILFTLSEGGSSSAARERAAIENRADARGGLPVPAAADPVGTVLGEMRRAEAQARSVELARALAKALGPVTDGATQAPLQSANFQVLRVPEIPSALLELGFLSNDADRASLVAPEWRARAAGALAEALAAWADSGGPLTRK